MSSKSRKPLQYFRISDKLGRDLDKRINRGEYPSRNHYFTAVGYETLYGCKFNNPKLPEGESGGTSTVTRADILKNVRFEKALEAPNLDTDTPTFDKYQEITGPLPQHVKDWIANTMPPLTEEEIIVCLHKVIEDTLLPVIAMKGVDMAYEKTWEDARAIFHEETGIWATQGDIHEAYVSYAAMHKRELMQYRKNQMEKHEG